MKNQKQIFTKGLLVLLAILASINILNPFSYANDDINDTSDTNDINNSNNYDPMPRKSTPKLIVNKYSIEPQLVKAGENFTMKLSFYNTSASRSVQNIKIFLTSDEKISSDGQNTSGGSVFTPVETSNTFYIDYIAPKGVVEKTITLYTVPDAAAKTYTVTANFEYEDSDANEYTATELIGVPVVQKTRLQLGELSLEDDIYINESNPLSLEFYNTGKSTLYNLMVKLEGKFDRDDSSYFVGNFEVGASDSFDTNIIPNKEGKLEGSLVFTYEDSTGQLLEHREYFERDVSEGFIDDEFEDEFSEENLGTFDKLKSHPFLSLGAILLLIFIIRKIIKKIKTNKENKSQISEEDIDDNFDYLGTDEDEN